MDQFRAETQRIQDELFDSDDELLEFMVLDQSVSRSIVTSRGKHGGSKLGRKKSLHREREAGHERIWRDYFSENPVYSDVLFRRRYRMRRNLFLRILDSVSAHDSYFVQKEDAVGILGLSPIQKATAALRMLAYGVAADATDEYCRISESTAMESMKRFVRAVRDVFEDEYLRQPTKSDLQTQMQINENRGFPGMFASLDCMHYRWKNCPVAWQGQYMDKDRDRSIILEAVADQKLWIWHAYFGLPGSNNDLNVLDRSPLVQNLLRSEAVDLSFVVNGNRYPQYYLLVDGIYPNYSIFVKTIHEPHGDKRQNYASMQEATRKDVERAFGVLQSRFAIVQNPSRMWQVEDISDILMACVILHNMIIEDEQDADLEPIYAPHPILPVRRPLSFTGLVDGIEAVHDKAAHYALRNDLIEHQWRLKGQSGRS